MLFGVSFCRRKTERRPRPNGGGTWLLLAILAVLLFVGLLFLAPQWLLVLLVVLLKATVIALVCLPKN